MRIATWNVNSLRSRHERFFSWLERHEPDFLCLQELKLAEELFPWEDLEKAGYQAAVAGQKTYNGVAIVSKAAAGQTRKSMDDGVDDPQARFVAGRFGDLHVISVYVPNGKTIDSDAYQYKLEWLKRLRTYLDTHHQTSDKILICGDYNVAPEEIDVARPDEWNDSVLCHDDARAALRHVEAWGLTDLFRMQKPDDAAYSWWDYRMLGFPKGNGLRIDHVLGTGAMAESVRDAWIDRDERKGKKPSDHAPVVVDF